MHNIDLLEQVMAAGMEKELRNEVVRVLLQTDRRSTGIPAHAYPGL